MNKYSQKHYRPAAKAAGRSDTQSFGAPAPKAAKAGGRSDTYETQEELFFACASFLLLLLLASADVLFKTT